MSRKIVFATTDSGRSVAMYYFRSRVLPVIALFFFLLAFYFRTPEPPHEESRILMDTIITIRAFPGGESEAVSRAFAVFETVESVSSFYRAGTELVRLNQTGSLPAVSSLTPLLQIAADYFRKSDGYFDPSFACLQKAYGFYSNAGRLPGQDEIDNLLKNHCGFDRVFARSEEGFTLASGSLIDLGGIAGGFAIEKAARVLREAGCKAFLIDDAGDIWFEGQKPDQTAWRIAVRDPRDNGSLAFIESSSPLAISTSGDYERFITVDGVRYGHIMNPHSGRPVDYYSSVTIVASEPVAADALSTAVFAMPPDIAFRWVEERNLAALFLTSTGTIHLSTAGRQYFSQVKTQ